MSAQQDMHHQFVQSDEQLQVLRQPNFFLPVIAEAIQDDLAFYAQDIDGKFTYLSKSAEKVLNQDLDKWINRPFSDALTDSPCNDPIRSEDWKTLEKSPAACRMCEIFDRDGNRVQLKFWHALIYHQGVKIGFSGIVKRLPGKANQSADLSLSEEGQLMAKVASLSNVERQVVEMVVNGQMNKQMATLLDVAVRTIESRRSRAMIKLEAKSLSELVQTWVHVRRVESRAQPASAS